MTAIDSVKNRLDEATFQGCAVAFNAGRPRSGMSRGLWISCAFVALNNSVILLKSHFL